MVAASPTPSQGPMVLMRLLMRYNLQPRADMHASWLPRDWPARHRACAALGEGAGAVLDDLLLSRDAVLGMAPDYQFDSRLKRLALLDSASLRRLAFYIGLCVHQPLVQQRGRMAAHIIRQTRRYGVDAVDFILDRVPAPSALRMDPKPLQQRPPGAGRVIVNRGYRLLQALLAPEGEAVLRRVQHKLPRRVAGLCLPPLKPHQARQLAELVLACIVPERLPQWDWLF